MTSQMIIFLLVFAAITVMLMFGLSFIKNQKTKDLILKIFAWTCFILHISIMWQTSLSNAGTGEAPRSVLWPFYFCNVAMYLLLIVATIKKDTKVFKLLATFVAAAGIIGAIITFVDYKFPFHTDGGVYSFERLKSTLSHVFLLVGSLYLFVGGYVKIRFKNVLPFIFGLLLNGFFGVALNWLFISANIDPNVNAMWLRHTSVSGVAFLTGIGLGVIALVLVGLFSLIWELIAVPIQKKKGKNELYFWQETKLYFSDFKQKIKNPAYLAKTFSHLAFAIIVIVGVVIISANYSF